jgi:hypothetical protein
LSAVPLSCLTGMNVETHFFSGMLLFICLLICFFPPFIKFLHFLPSAVLGAFVKLRKAIVSFVVSVRLSLFVRPSAWNNSASIGTYFHEIWYLSIFRKSVGKIQVSFKCDENNGYSTWRQIYFLIISRSILLRMRNVSVKSCRENQNTHFVFSNFFPSPKTVPFVR